MSHSTSSSKGTGATNWIEASIGGESDGATPLDFAFVLFDGGFPDTYGFERRRFT